MSQDVDLSGFDGRDLDIAVARMMGWHVVMPHMFSHQELPHPEGYDYGVDFPWYWNTELGRWETLPRLSEDIGWAIRVAEWARRNLPFRIVIKLHPEAIVCEVQRYVGEHWELYAGGGRPLARGICRAVLEACLKLEREKR